MSSNSRTALVEEECLRLMQTFCDHDCGTLDSLLGCLRRTGFQQKGCAHLVMCFMPAASAVAHASGLNSFQKPALPSSSTSIVITTCGITPCTANLRARKSLSTFVAPSAKDGLTTRPTTHEAQPQASQLLCERS